MRIPCLILLIICLFLTGCGDSPGTDPQSELINFKIINGLEVNQATFPQLVELIIKRTNGSTGLCSGTVIGPQHILTAGHCVSGDISSITMYSYLGALPADTYFLHPGFRIDPLLQAAFHDIAVIETPPHGLPRLPIIATYAVQEESDLMLLGFGLDEGGRVGNLKTGSTRAVSVTVNHIFGPAFYGEGFNPCNGDSGGPAVQTIQTDSGELVTGIVGIVSTGTTGTCYDGDITHYVNLQNPDTLNFIITTASGVVVR